MRLIDDAAAAPPRARRLAGPLLWRVLVALTLLLTSCRQLQGAPQGGITAAANQEDALLQLKSAFPGWGAALAEHHLQGWQPAATPAGSGNAAAGGSGPCGWSFVECDEDSHVITLELSPAALWQLSICSGNGKLYSQHVSECRVQLPAPLAALTQPLSRLPALRHLTLNGLGLTGSLPPEWPTTLLTLQSLDLSGNALTGGLPAAWIAPGAWPALAVLDLSHNPLGGSLPSILPAALNATAARAAAQAWIEHTQAPGLPPPPPPLQQLILSGCQLSGSLPFDWALLGGLMLLWLNDNRLAGVMPANWGSPNPLAEHVEDLNLWLEGASVQVQRNQLQGPVACCGIQTMVQPGNGGLCQKVEPRRGQSVLVVFTRQVCSAAAGQTIYCSTEPAVLPSCLGSAAGGQGLRMAGSGGSTVAGSLAAAAGGVLAVAAAYAAVGLQRRRQRRWQHRAAQVPSNWDAELAFLQPQVDATWQQLQQQQPGSMAAPLVGSSPPGTSSGRSSGSGGAAGSQDVSGEQAGPRSSWRLHSRSLQLQADDFQILLDKSGRPDLLGAGATAKVYRGLLLGSQPVAIKLLAPAAACKLLDPSPGATTACSSASGASPDKQQQQQQQEAQQQRDDHTRQQLQHERRMWREVELLRQCRHPNLVQLLGVYVSPGGPGTAPAQQQRRLMLVTELLEGGSLSGRLGEPALRWYRCGGRVALDVARGLAFLHQLGIAHRDVKSANILLTTRDLPDCRPERPNAMGVDGSSGGSGGGDSGSSLASGTASLPEGAAQGECGAASQPEPDGADVAAPGTPLAKLGDVGLARALDQGSMSLVGGGTILYAAPEQLANSNPGLAADMFSLAWVVHEIATGERLLRRGQGRPLRAPEECPAAIVRLVERCLETDPAARPTAAEAVQVIAANLAAGEAV